MFDVVSRACLVQSRFLDFAFFSQSKEMSVSWARLLREGGMNYPSEGQARSLVL